MYVPTNYTAHGLTPRFNLERGHQESVNCFFTYGINHHQFTSPDGLKTTCLHESLR
jgi:hypothetical protein